MVKLLIEQEIDVNTIDQAGNSALHYAAANGKKDIGKQLLENNADVSLTNKAEQQAIGYSNLLLSIGAKCESNGQSALFYAARHHSKNIIETLLLKGANPSFVSVDDNSLFSELINKDIKISTLHFVLTLLTIIELLGLHYQTHR